MMAYQKKHNPYFDFLRGVAILMVVGIHTYPGNLSMHGEWYEFAEVFAINFFNCAVPLFLAISGYFIARKNLSTLHECSSFWKKQIPTVYIPCLIFSFPWFVLSCVSANWGGWKLVLNYLLCGYSVYYFILLIIECYLVAPFLVRHNSKKVLVIVAVISCLSMLALEIVKYHYSVELPLIVRGSAPVMLLFFYMGIFISKHSRDYSLWIPIALMIVGLITGLMQMDYVESHTDMPGQGQKITLFLFDAGFILLCMSGKMESLYRDNVLTRTILYVGEISFGIYFTHVYLIFLINRMAPSLPGLWPVKWLLSIILTIAFIAFVKRLFPAIARRYLGYR